MDSVITQAEGLLAQREIDAALALYAQADAAAYADRIDGGRWMCHMLAGEYEKAWRCSDAIRGRGVHDPHRFWNGEAIDGRRVMLRCLHGYGDTVMYLRWLPMLNARAKSVTVQACPEMLPLLGRMPGSHRVVGWNADEAEGGEHAWDVQIESAELPYVFRAQVAALPAPTRFDFTEAKLRTVREAMGQRTKPRVGLVWSGSMYDPARSIPFTQFSSLLANHALEYWSLQAQRDNAPWQTFCEERGWSRRVFYRADGSHDGIADMAAFASEMDLVITIDTMAAHLAASLGVPTWLLLKREADWRWMIDREDSPWYPTMRLFRQSTAGDWSVPLTRVCDALRDVCEEWNA